MCPTRRPFWSIGTLVIAVVLTAVLGAAAAAQVATLGSPAPEASAEPISAPLTEQDSLLAWAVCMRENGVDMDDPRFDLDGQLIGGLGKGGPGNAVDPKGEAYQAANDACIEFLVSFKAPPAAEQQAEIAEQQLAWAACMRTQGIDLPDPGPDGSFSSYDWKVDLKGDEFIAADAACRSSSGLSSK